MPKAKQTKKGNPFDWTLEGFIPATSLLGCGRVYRSAAAAVLADLKKEGEEGSLAAYPLVFLYRHAVEACIKGILILFGPPVGVDAKAVHKRRHDLCQQMADLSRVATSVDRSLSKRTVSTIHKFNATDPKGTMFRYDDVREYKGTFDLAHFSEEIEFVLDELTSLYSHLDAEMQQG